MTLLIHTMCLPPIHELALMQSKDTVRIEAHEHYQKRSYRNRIYINGSQGLLLITIPLQKGKNAQTPIREVSISYEEDWISLTTKKIQSCYGNAPYFEYYFDDLRQILSAHHEKLWDLNLTLIQFLQRHMNLTFSIESTDQYVKEYPTAEITDLRMGLDHSMATSEASTNVYQSTFPILAKDLVKLSSLDLLMCYGPESSLILNNYIS